MVTVAEAVWDRWRELESQFGEPAIVLLFASDLTNEDALLALHQAARSAVRSLEQDARLQAGGEERRTGNWALASVPEGVAVRIDEEPDSFEELVGRIVQRLDAQGVDGRLDLFEAAEAVVLPERIDLLECRLRVNGTRYHIRYRNYGWRPDWKALSDTVDVGLAWCLASAAQLPLSLTVGLISSVTLSLDDDVVSLVREGLDQTRDLGVVSLTSASPDRFRTLAACPSLGRVSFIEGGNLQEGGWFRSLHTLRNLMIRASERLVYGFIKRGEDRVAAELGTSQIQDWPRIPHFNAWDVGAEAFEDEFVPDAFGVQMLGPGHAGRLPVGPNWRARHTSEDKVVLEYVDPASWFEAPLASGAPFRFPAPPTAPIPDLLLRARADFRELLFNRDIPTNG